MAEENFNVVKEVPFRDVRFANIDNKIEVGSIYKNKDGSPIGIVTSIDNKNMSVDVLTTSEKIKDINSGGPGTYPKNSINFDAATVYYSPGGPFPNSWSSVNAWSSANPWLPSTSTSVTRLPNTWLSTHTPSKENKVHTIKLGDAFRQIREKTLQNYYYEQHPAAFKFLLLFYLNKINLHNTTDKQIDFYTIYELESYFTENAEEKIVKIVTNYLKKLQNDDSEGLSYNSILSPELRALNDNIFEEKNIIEKSENLYINQYLHNTMCSENKIPKKYFIMDKRDITGLSKYRKMQSVMWSYMGKDYMRLLKNTDIKIQNTGKLDTII